ncbi:conserved hypothetical protein [Theileria equi strain WA]|uniref:Uncharacterized protein n=1 Tax=Theileria equi strain WA TaxID=1537102 RepID=L1LEF4_THEEQ|nr:conserved hypothetical protein [Theileria equi strain WA]EKX73635.1 conserved hypothetical protein [Theileria equi strain WA]|eukprot:XP_004833087.1 conserved hypothetical protein [Theileria equi strain WA]
MGARITLDISRADSDDRFTRIHYYDPRVSYLVLTPLEGLFLDKVVDGLDEVWEVQTDLEFCKNIKIHNSGGKPALLYLNIWDGRSYQFLHFRNLQGKWVEISRPMYSEILRDLVLNIKFDIDAPFETELFRVKECPSAGTHSLIYFPDQRYRLKEITNGPKSIWKAQGEEEKCDYFVLHGNIGNPKLVHAFVTSGDDHKILFFVKHQNKWDATNQEEFYRVVECIENDRPYEQMETE